jgi:hypothetical protein
VDLFEAQRVREADAAGRGGLDRAQVADEEDRPLVHLAGPQPVDLVEQSRRRRQLGVAAQGERADRRAVEEGRAAGGALPPALQGEDLVDEGGAPPRLGAAERVVQRDHVGGRLLDHGVAVDLQLAQDGRLSGAGCAGEDVTGHDAPSTRSG